MMSTGGSFAPSSFVMSPTCAMSGKRIFVTSMGKASISLAHTGDNAVVNGGQWESPYPIKQAAHRQSFHLATA